MDQLEILKLTGGEVSIVGIGNKIVEGAKKIIGHKKGVGDGVLLPQDPTVPGHPASKRTQVGDLDTPKELPTMDLILKFFWWI